MVELYRWQKEALNALRMSSFSGIVIAQTGVGKTLLAQEVMKELRVKTLIVVPTIALLDQWHKSLIQYGFKEEDISLYYGVKKSLNKITIAVVNSICEIPNLDKQFSLLICDEVHHLSDKARVFSQLLLNNRFKYTVGLTATLDKSDDKNRIIFDRIGTVIYEYKTKDAVDDNLLNSFSIVNVGIELPHNDREYLTRLDVDIKAFMGKFDSDLDKVIHAVKKGNKVAAKTLSLINKRKQFYNKGLSKVERAVDLILEHQHEKVIVFNEFVETAMDIYKRLVDKGLSPYLYYSNTEGVLRKLTAQEKKQMLSSFSNNPSGVMISVKALDEGLNVPNINVGIIVGYNRTHRQAIQRLGRILRKQENKHPTMYVLYYKGTSDVGNVSNFNALFKDVAKIRWH